MNINVEWSRKEGLRDTSVDETHIDTSRDMLELCTAIKPMVLDSFNKLMSSSTGPSSATVVLENSVGERTVVSLSKIPNNSYLVCESASDLAVKSTSKIVQTVSIEHGNPERNPISKQKDSNFNAPEKLGKPSWFEIVLL